MFETHQHYFRNISNLSVRANWKCVLYAWEVDRWDMGVSKCWTLRRNLHLKFGRLQYKIVWNMDRAYELRFYVKLVIVYHS